MTFLSKTSSEVERLALITESIRDTISSTAPNLDEAISSLLDFTLLYKKNVQQTVSILIEQCSLSLNDRMEQEDKIILEQIGKSLEDGNLLEATINIHKIQDKYTREAVYYEFKELSLYIGKVELITVNRPKALRHEIANNFNYLKEDGRIEIANIDSFSKEQYSQSLEKMNPGDNKEVVEDNHLQTETLFDDEDLDFDENVKMSM